MLAAYLVFAVPAVYQLLAIYAALRYVFFDHGTEQLASTELQGVSVLKPLRGLDPNTRAAFISQIEQTHRRFEILFCVRDDTDPAVAEVLHLKARYPDAAIELHIGCPEMPNRKVGALMELARHAKYPIWVVNDSDILVGPEYLATVVRPLVDPAVGVVTCLYRASAHTLAAAWESLGIATDFMPSTLVAQLIGVREFGLGSTLAFRAADLESAGGFAGFADFLADDYQLSKRITALGKRTVLSHVVVETSLGEATWGGIWNHQLRWGRTIRASKGAAYSGLFVSHAGVWVVVLLLLQSWRMAFLLFALRATLALITARLVLRDPLAKRTWFFAPVWDLFAFGIWVTAHFGRTVRWRGLFLRIDKEGRILSERPA